MPSKPGGDRLYFNGSNIPIEQAGEQYKDTPDTKSLVTLAKSLESSIMLLKKPVFGDGHRIIDNVPDDNNSSSSGGGGSSSGGGYSFSSKVRPEVQQAFNEEYKAMTEKFGKISTITEVEPMTWADKSEYGNFNDSSGVLSIRFAEQKDCQKRLAQAAVENKQNGKWSSSHPNHVFRHEIGHAIQLEHKLNDKNWNSKLGRIETIMSGIDKKMVSVYAFRDTSEFISECIAESMTKKARKTAKDVVNIILESD